MIDKLQFIMSSLLNGDISVLNLTNKIEIDEYIKELFKKTNHTQDEILCMDYIIKISNLVYNNTDRSILFLDHGVYDLVLELYKIYNSNYQVGSDIVHFEPVGDINIDDNSVEDYLKPVRKVSSEFIENAIFFDDMAKIPEFRLERYYKAPVFKDIHISKRIANTKHVCPKLVGTLDKSKFVLNSQAAERGVINDSNVKIFERDFLGKHVKDGVLDPNRKFYMVAELKYDGLSVEAEVSDKIYNARSRGDTANDVATDLTPILEGYKFHDAVNKVDSDNKFNIKFEAIITHMNLERMSIERDRVYANCRNAIIGLFGSSDANRFRDYITLVPLATSLEVDRLTEIEFLNSHYTSGVNLIYSVLYGNYVEMLFQVKKFLEEAEYMRNFLPYMYDGIVLSYIEPDLIDILGRENFVNKYSMAIKFNSLKRYTNFIGYSYTVGKNGVLTPMINFLSVEFYGTTHTEATGHSYNRFRELALRKGDVICVEYVNDVMCYVSKPDINENRANTNLLEEFPTHCPYCETELEISKSGKSAKCPNNKCPERNINRLSDVLTGLGIKDFKLETMKTIRDNNPKFEPTLSFLLSLTKEDVSYLGPNDSETFINVLNGLRTTRLYDYQALGSIGFTNIANELLKLILKRVSVIEIIQDPDDILYDKLVSIKGIGPVSARTIVEERYELMDDIRIVFYQFKEIVNTFGTESDGKTIRFTGCRNGELVKRLTDLGHSAGEGSITKATDYLLVPYDGYDTGKKVAIAVANGVTIVSIDEFISNIDAYLQ